MLKLLFAEDQVIISTTEVYSQKAEYKLNQIITEHVLTISAQKQNWWNLKDPVRRKILIDDKIIKRVNSFNNLGYLISYEKEIDINNKLNNYLKITGFINNKFRLQKTLKEIKMKLWNTPALPVLYDTAMKTGPLKQDTQEE